MEHKNILSFIAKDIQKSCERLGIYAEFTPKDEKHIVSSDFKMQPAIFKSIHVEASVYVHPSETVGEEGILELDVDINYRHNYWDGGENGFDLGWCKYQIRQDDYNKDKIFVDNYERLCLIHKWRGITI